MSIYENRGDLNPTWTYKQECESIHANIDMSRNSYIEMEASSMGVF